MGDRGTQTPTSRYGAELRIHFEGLSFRMALLTVVVSLLCLLNGCSYYLYWRNVFYTREDALPVALHATIAGVFFLFMMAQLLIQLALRTMIEHMSVGEREWRIRRCYLLLVLSILPSTAGHVTLFAQGWFDSSKPFAVVFISTAYLDVLVVACVLSYIWSSICVDWLHAGVSRVAIERRAKMCRKWNEHLMSIVTAPALRPFSSPDRKP